MPRAMRTATVALATLLAGCTASGAVESPSERPSVAATGSPTSVPEASPDLSEIVISPSDPPAGMSHDETGEGDSVLTYVIISGRQAEFLALPGFRDGRVTTFSGESGALLSLGLSFESPQNAATAFDLFLDELQSEEGYGFGPGPDANLGDEGTCDEGENPALGGLQESICLWRNGSLVLLAGGPIDPEHLRPYADAMDEAVTASPTSARGTFGADDLPRIVLSEDHLQPGMTLDDLTTGFDALGQPVGFLESSVFTEQPGFLDARMTRIGTSGEGSYWKEGGGGYVSWTAVYETEAEAEGAFDVLIDDHESEIGWGMDRAGRPPQGDDGVTLQGPAYGFDANLLNVWRHDNLLLAAGAFGVTATAADVEEQLASITEGMDRRATDGP